MGAIEEMIRRRQPSVVNWPDVRQPAQFTTNAVDVIVSRIETIAVDITEQLDRLGWLCAELQFIDHGAEQIGFYRGGSENHRWAVTTDSRVFVPQCNMLRECDMPIGLHWIQLSSLWHFGEMHRLFAIERSMQRKLHRLVEIA